MATFNVLILGDIVGRPGRQALIAKLPELKEKYQPDLIIANAENLAHGFGVNEKVLSEMEKIGIDFFTSGNHIFKTTDDLQKLFAKHNLIRPANYPPETPGPGYKLLEIGTTKILIINLMGRVFIQEKYPDIKFQNPFKVLDDLLMETKSLKPDVIIVDVHAEATSEKKSLGAYADGRVSLVFGTHTHIQTSDDYIMPEGTGYITDIGMVGIEHSSLGMNFDNIIKTFVSETKLPKTISTHGICLINGIFAKINTRTGKTENIEKIKEYQEV